MLNHLRRCGCCCVHVLLVPTSHHLTKMRASAIRSTMYYFTAQQVLTAVTQGLSDAGLGPAEPTSEDTTSLQMLCLDYYRVKSLWRRENFLPSPLCIIVNSGGCTCFVLTHS
jgi:hypothetical protein